MASFTDLVRAQRQSGKSVITSLSGAYNQMNMQKYDPRNALFSRGGLMTALFPELKGYQATASSRSPSSLMAQQAGSSPTALSSIARDARISARNSMALPSIARNMAQLVRIWGGTPAKYFERAGQREAAYESKYSTGRKGMPGLGKSSAGGGFNLLGMLGGIGSAAGSLLSGAGSIIGSILGGIGSLVGGAFRGIFGVLGGALGNMGFMGVVLAGVVGFALYSLYKALDFSKLGGGISDSLGAIKDSLSGLYKELDGLTGGRLSTFIDDTQKMFKKTTDKIAAGMETALNLFKDLGLAVIKDMYGFVYNIFKENQGKVLGMVTIGALAAFAGVGGLKGAAVAAAISAAMAAYGSLTSERSLEDMEKIKKAKEDELEYFRKTGQMNIQADEGANIPSKAEYEKRLIGEIGSLGTQIEEKKARTSNTQSVLNRMNSADIGADFDRRFAERQAQGSPTPAGATSYSYDKKVTFNSLTRAQQNQLMEEQAKREGSTKPGTVGFRHMNPGNIIAKSSTEVYPEQAKFGGVPGETITHEGVTRTFVRFPNWQAGWEAQRDLWSRKYGNMDLQLAIKKWVNPSASEMASGAYGNYERSLMKVAGATGTPIAGMPEERIASAERPKPSPAPGAPAARTSMSDSVASLAYKQITALDTMMGGKLMQGSTALADMLRDVTREFMSNPTFVDNSQTVNNSMPSALASSALGSAYNADATNLLVDRTTSNY
jgi:hypothetical protein